MLCPIISICKHKINLDTYMKVCANPTEDAYKNCEIFKKIGGEMKTPTEWSQTLVTRPIP